ncbi:sensor histidine kinase [Nonomuraea jiangxiensis]|uniref:histidine kinase n=1 Tax=Nonomuraea jiangxiensis TaxID=633440 RepID=A0A1G8TU63_9ACTN|nr:histidine kinase [Nonomuraea jiangxiensis]SDJ45116.1 Signal transduction histidine kinase [Nonomuraea jiangxiensis]
MGWWPPGPTAVLIGVAAASAGLSTVGLWWAVATAVAAFLAGMRPGPARPAVLVLVGVLAVGMVVVVVVPAWLAQGDRFLAVVVGAAMVPWFAGRFWRQYRELVRAGWERAESLEREQGLLAERVRLRERTLIAQDMHDVLGHELSLIALAAGALHLDSDLAPEHRAAAQDIRARAGTAVERLGEVIGVLREDGRPGGPAGGTVSDLVRRASAAGLPVTLHVEGEAGRVPPVAERAAYRVVQEALTNAAKHAPDASVTVRLRYTDTEIQVVVDSGPPTATGRARGSGPATATGLATAARSVAAAGGGWGLVGLDERVRLAGGVLVHGPTGRGFTVSARLPRDRAAHTGFPAEDPVVPRERRRVHRNVRRTVAVAIMLPVATAVVVGGLLRTWEILAVRHSVLAPDLYAGLRIGQPRPDLARLLPEQQTARRPPAAEPAAPGTTCEYYAMTADPFDDRYADAYRLCFRAGRLESADALVAR